LLLINQVYFLNFKNFITACNNLKSNLESFSEQKKEANQIKIGVYKNIFLIV